MYLPYACVTRNKVIYIARHVSWQRGFLNSFVKCLTPISGSYSSSCGLLSVGHLIGQLFNVPRKIFIYLALSILPDIVVTANSWYPRKTWFFHICFSVILQGFLEFEVDTIPCLVKQSTNRLLNLNSNSKVITCITFWRIIIVLWGPMFVAFVGPIILPTNFHHHEGIYKHLYLIFIKTIPNLLPTR